MAFGACKGDVEESFFLFNFHVSLGVVAGEFVFGEAGNKYSVKFEAFGLVDSEDWNAGVVGVEEVEIAGEGGAVGEFGEADRWWACGVVVALKELDEAVVVCDTATFFLA